MAEAIRIDSLSLVESSGAPPWHLVHFDVHCARCGQDLRGLTAPVCPGCHLEFDWSDAVPLENLTCGNCHYNLYGLSNSCPECGTAIDWDEALLRLRVSEIPVFEYRWPRRPIRSFISTWFLALRPRRLWRVLSMHHPPRLKPLIFWATVIAICCDLALPVGTALTTWAIPLVQTFSWPGGSYLAELPVYLLGYLSNENIHAPVLIFLWWCILNLLALMVYRQSMRIYKVRTRHVIRVWIYSSFAFLPLAVLGATMAFGIAALLMDSRNWQLRFWWLLQYKAYPLFALAFLIHIIWSIRQGYRHYLRIPHSLGIAIVSQVMAALGLAITYPRLLIGLF